MNFFRQITTFIKVCMAFVFRLQILLLIDSSKIYQLKGLKPKNIGHTNFYESCDLTKKVYLVNTYTTPIYTNNNVIRQLNSLVAMHEMTQHRKISKHSKNG